MFERIKRPFRRLYRKVVGMIDAEKKPLGNIIDHPLIAIDHSEYKRILENKRLYSGLRDKVSYKTPSGVTKHRDYLGLNMAKVLAHRYAVLTFNEKCKINTSASEAQRFVDAVLQDNRFHKNYGPRLESCYAMGGLAMRPYVDGNKIKILWCHGDTFFPLASNTSDVSEGCIVSKRRATRDGVEYYYTLYEFHRWIDGVYVIQNELYESEEAATVGVRVPLSTVFPDVQDFVGMEDLSRPLFVYQKPAGANNINLDSPLGLSIFDNAKPTLKKLDETADQFFREIQLGRTRFAVSDHYLKGNHYERAGKDEGGMYYGPPNLHFDADEEIFQLLSGGLDNDVFKDVTTEIRSDTYIESINFYLRTLEMEVGFSPGTFRFDADGLKTATEVVSESSITYQTRSDQLTMVETALRELAQSICELGSAAGLYHGPLDFEVTVDFDDGVFADRDAQLNFYMKAAEARLIPRSLAAERIFNLPKGEGANIYAQVVAEETGRDMALMESMDADSVIDGV